MRRNDFLDTMTISTIMVILNRIIILIIEVGGMKKTVSAMKVRQNLGQIMNEASLRGDDFIIERAGKPVAVLVSMEKYQIMERDREKARTALGTIRKKMENAEPEKIEKLIGEGVRAVRKKSA
jgi:prevent-host-death family protein